MLDNLFTTYEAVEPPAIYKDKSNLKIKDVEENNFTQYPIVTTIDIPVTDFEDYPGVVSPFDIQVEEPFEKPKIQPTSKGSEVVNLARQFLGKPYVWGSSDPDKGFDCSGLINYVYKQIGIDIPRTSHAIGKTGTSVSLSEVQPGDIIYTSSKRPTGGHVKMVSSVSDGQIFVIEAKGKKWGIVESPLTYTDNIKSIRRILSSETPDEVPSNTTQTGRFSSRKDFMQALNSTYRDVLQEHGLDPDYSYVLTSSAAIESAWGKSVSGTFNYGGVKGKTGTVKYTIDYIPGQGNVRRKQTFRNFNSIRDYCNFVVDLLQRDRYKSFSKYAASQPMQFWRHTLEAGYGGGSQANISKYMTSMSKIYNLVKRETA